ncbi:MAG: hypothetical protein JSW06_08520 [Thermoplasmatales archaeon]|nr:MAG: hypothetical protein JSW06_08520 [Thermoplasmatales archaeon]
MKNENLFVENEAVDLSKSEINAERILRRCHIHDFDAGGVFSLISGSQGSAKTSVTLSFMSYTMKHHLDEKMFFSNCYNAPLQFVKVGRGNFNIMVKKDSGVTFHDRDNKLEEIHPKVTYFKDYRDCYDKALPGVCNAVFFGDRMRWMDFIHFLRGVGEWVHVYIDELSEISPQFTSGKTFHKIGGFASDCKEVRKCMMNLHTNSQSISDIDHRIRSKVMIRIYLPGARAENVSRIKQTALDNLNEDPIYGNEAYLEFSGKFGKTVFRDIYKPISGLHWEARVDER